MMKNREVAIKYNIMLTSGVPPVDLMKKLQLITGLLTYTNNYANAIVFMCVNTKAKVYIIILMKCFLHNFYGSYKNDVVINLEIPLYNMTLAVVIVCFCAFCKILSANCLRIHI